MKTIENNKLIAEFMGITSKKTLLGWVLIDSNGKSFTRATFKESQIWYEFLNNPKLFHSSWDWLMPVVEKIESLGYFCMINKWTSVYTGTDGERISVTTAEGESKITNTYNAVVEFIKWYNENK